MTNPNNGVGTNGAFGGRTSVNALNDVLACFTSRGILNGWACAPSEGMTVAVGGADGVRDVALAEDNAGNKTTVNNINATPVEVTLEAAPSTNSRIDAIVTYVDNPPQGEATVVDNPGAVGLIAVTGTTAASPSAPDEDAIRTAITADGASGTTAYYVVLATVAVASGTTDITADMITAGGFAGVGSDNVDWGTIEEVVSTYNGTVVGIKFANGLLVNTGRCYASNIAVNTSNGSIYTSGKYLPSYDYAVPFVERYGSALWGMSPGGWSGWVAHVENTNPLTNPGNVLFARGVSTNSGTFAAGCIAIGRWK